MQLTEQDKNSILDRVSEGDSFFKIAKSFNIHFRTLFSAVDRDPEFKKQVNSAREARVDDLVCSLIGITADCTTMAEVSAAKIESENIKWAASKFVPAVFGESLNVNVNHSLDLSAILLASENRVIPILQAKLPSIPAIPPSLINAGIQQARGDVVDAELIPQHVTVMSNNTSGIPADIKKVMNPGDSLPLELLDMI